MILIVLASFTVKIFGRPFLIIPYLQMEEKNKKAESNKNSVIEFVEGWDMIQTLGEGAFGE